MDARPLRAEATAQQEEAPRLSWRVYATAGVLLLGLGGLVLLKLWILARMLALYFS